MIEHLVSRDDTFRKLTAEYNTLSTHLKESVEYREKLVKRIFMTFFKRNSVIMDKHTRKTYRVRCIGYSKTKHEWALTCVTEGAGAPLKVTLEMLLNKFDF